MVKLQPTRRNVSNGMGRKQKKVSKTFKVWVKISFVIADEQTCMRKHPQRHKRNRKKFLSIKYDLYSPKQDANIPKTANLAMILVTSDQLIGNWQNESLFYDLHRWEVHDSDILTTSVDSATVFGKSIIILIIMTMLPSNSVTSSTYT